MIGTQLRKLKKKGPVAATLVGPVLDIYDFFFGLHKARQLKMISDEEYVRREFYRKFKYPLPLDNPRTLNEKIHWRKLRERNPFFAMASDKFAVREYVSQQIGDPYLIPLLQVLDHETELDYSQLPRQFVIKGAHDCGSAILVQNKKQYSPRRLRRAVRKILRKRTYYTHLREWQYRDIPPRVLVEPLLTDEKGQIPKDYKLHVFQGKTEMIQVANPAHTRNGMYDTDWNVLPFSFYNPQPEEPYPRPKGLVQMIELAEILAKDLNYVRVDFFNLNGRIYFGELTFTPNNGDAKFDPPEYDLYYGQKFILDERFQPAQ